MSTREKMYAKAQRENPVEHPVKGSSSSSRSASTVQNQGDSTSSSPRISPEFKDLHSFQREWNKADSYPLRYQVIRTWWPRVSKEELPRQHFALVHSRIGYELQAQAYTESSTPMPPSVDNNLQAIRQWDVDRLTLNIRRMLKIEIGKNPDQQQGDEGMPKKAAGKTKEARAGVAHLYLEIFENQAKAKLTDLQIQASIKAKTGSEPTFKNIASYRHAFNQGNLAGQKSCPVKLKAVRPPSKAKPKKPMSEETKKKLKEYSAKKKKAKG